MIALAREVMSESRRNRIGGLAAEVTFFAVLSLFPGLLIFAGALGSLQTILGHDVAARSEAAVLEFLGRILTDRARSTVDAVRELFEGQSGGLLTTAALIASWTLSSGFAALIRALDLVYGIEERRTWLNVRVTAFVLALGSTLILAVVVISIVMGPMLGDGAAMADRVGLGPTFSFIWDWLRAPIAFALLVFWTTTVFHLGPNRSSRAEWKRDLPGGVLAAFLLLAVSYGFRFYLGLAYAWNQVVGVLGGGLLLMLWLYFLSLAMLAGGTLNGILRRRFRRGPLP